MKLAVALAAVIGTVLCAPAFARAHGGGNFSAPSGTAPTIDGTISAGEWTDAPAYSVTFSTGNATVRFKHDATYLYVAAVVQDPAPGPLPEFSIFFDNNHDGLKNVGDDVWNAFAAGSGSDFFYSPSGTGGASHYNDTTDPATGGAGTGTNDTVAAGTSTAGQVVFEFRHALCSADTAHDVCTSDGETLGVDFQYERGATLGDFSNAPGSNLFNPSSNWADLTIPDNTPPQVTLTQPDAGAILRGNVRVTATASDNVGVTRVDFKYFGPAGTPTLIGSATNGGPGTPYWITFDTTQFPNTLIKDATIYAYAYDAANNSTQSVGHAVTIDNTAPGTIVFESDRDGNSEIWSMDPDGTNLKQLTSTSAPVVNTRPSLSPDGNTVVFERTSNGVTQIYSMKYDGTSVQQLTSTGNNGAPAFSPEGKIAFHSDRTGLSKIWVMNVDGSGQTQVTVGAGNDSNPSWNSDSTAVAFDSDRSGNRDIWTQPVANPAAAVNLTQENAGTATDPDWSPDGQTILFVSDVSGKTSVWKMNADGTGREDLTQASGYDADVAWAPDGNHLAFVRDAGGQDFNVWTARPSQQANGFGIAGLRLTDVCIGYTVGGTTDQTYTIQAPPSSANCNITQDHSITGDTPSQITFDNQSGRTVDIYWLDYDGNRVYYNTLGSPGSYTQPTYNTHPWVMIAKGPWRNSFPDWGPVPDPAQASPFTVNTTADHDDGTCSVSDCTLREAINAANGDDVSSQIHFDIDGAGVHTIQPVGLLPPITQAVTIDGYTQPGASANTLTTGDNAVVQIQLSGVPGGYACSCFAAGLDLQAPSIVRGLVVNGGFQAGIAVETAGSEVRGNFVGTTPDGNSSGGGLSYGVYLSGASNATVGGSLPGDRNLISGVSPASGGVGVELTNGSTTNTVQGNLIGTNAAGTAALANGVGAQIGVGGTLNTISGNVVSGNNGIGVWISIASATGNLISGNKVGTTAAGTGALGNGGDGIRLQNTSGNTVGGTSVTTRNVVAANIGHGIFLIESHDNTVQGNYSGVNAAGTAALGNGIDGIAIDGGGSGNTIGGSAAGAGNLASGNQNQGISIFRVSASTAASGNVVRGNRAGVNASGTGFIPNGGDGIRVYQASNTTIGGQNAGEGNEAAGNGASGVRIESGAIASSGNSIRVNRIHDNGGLGIDLVNGANNNQPAPALTSAITNGTSTEIKGTLNAAPNSAYTFDFYASPTCDAGGAGEGASWIGYAILSTNASGSASIDTGSGITGAVSPGNAITATATDAGGNTSEFSGCVTARQAAVLTGVSLTPIPPSSPAGAAQVKLADTPPLALILAQSGVLSAPVNQSPVNQSPVNQSPVNQTPINQLAATNAPVNQTPINQSPVNQTPVNQSGFAELTQSISQLRSITLSTIPLLRAGGWSALLTGTSLAGLPEQSVTLGQVYALNPLPGPLQPGAANPIKIGDLDLSRSPLGSVSAIAFSLGKLPLSQIPVGTGTSATTFTSWCTSANVTGVDCGSGASVLSTSIQGAPVNQSPVNQSPVNQSLIQALAAYGTPVNQTPVNQTPINQSRIGALPVNQTPVNQSPVNQLSLQPILAANAPVNQSPVNQTPINQLSTPNDLFYCLPSTAPTGSTAINCSTATLKDAVNSVRSGVTFGSLRSHDPLGLLGNWTIADLRYFGSMTIGDLLLSLPQPNSFTLADVLLLVLGSPTGVQGLSFEAINIFDTALQASATGGSTVQYRARFTVSGQNGDASTVSVSSTIAKGFLYVPGSSTLVQGISCGATALGNPTQTTLNDGRVKLTWNANTVVGNSYSLCFTARPGLVLGPQAAALDARPEGGTMVSATGTTLDVTETLEPNGTPSTSPLTANDSFYLSHLTSASDVDYYRFTAPAAGTVVTFHLSHLPTDFDLVVYGPAGTALRPPLTTGAIPLDGAPVTDAGVDVNSTSSTLPSQTLDDLRLQTDLPMVGVSASRGTDPEDVVVISQGTGTYTVQITGYNGAMSAKPYMLRVETQPPRVSANVSSRTITGTMGPALPTLPTGLNTVFLVNRQQLEGVYGSTRATNVMNALSNNSAAFTNLGFPNVVLSVDRFATVQTAYAAWNANPGRPAAANGVVQAINGVIDSQIRSQPNGAGFKYLVIVGDDQVIPFARLDDFTVTASNETGYANTFASSSDLFASLNAGQMLSDDPYGDVNPVPYLTRQLYIPELSVGRLVETPEEIIGTLNRFSQFNGRLDPATSLTTGYDFLFDGATGVNSPFASRFGATNAKTLLDNPSTTGNSWTLSQLIGAFLPSAPATSPSITSLNGHASHFQFQPPNNDTTGAREPLLTTSAVTGSSSSLTNRLIFSMGCHAGLSVADSLVTGTVLDWPQAFAQKGAGAFLGNTGYGFGDSLVVAYSEELNRLFAEKIAAGAAVGDALASAKQGYYGALGVFGVYDEKAMAEFTLYGLPMWSVTAPPATGQAQTQTQAFATAESTGTPQAAAASAASPSVQSAPITTDPTTGLDAEPFNVDPVNTPHTVTDVGTYWSGPDGVQVTHLRPLQPKALVALSGTTAHGALITELTSGDTNCVDPVFARPILDLGANERELRFADVAFPSKLQTVRTFETPTGRVQQLVLVTGQFFTQTCNSNSDPQLGVQRLFSHAGGRVFRSASNDYFAPAFQLIEANQAGGNASFIVDVTDKTPTGTGPIKQVLVAVRSGTASNWTFVNLAQAGTSARWTGGTAISGSQFEYFVQAVDAVGNVGVSTNKGFYFAQPPPPPPPTGDISATLSGPQTSSGWYTAAPTLTVTVPTGVTKEASVDGGAYGPVPASITGDGLHTVDIRASNGGTAQILVPVDTTSPTIVINTPVQGAQYVLYSAVDADYSCVDAGSGVASCPGSVPSGSNIDTSTVGTKTFTVGPATDRAGHTAAAKTVTYTVVRYRRVLFTSTRTGGGDIYAMNADNTGQAIQLTTGSTLDEQPSWSPDGSKIAFARATAKNNLDIYVMDANGANVRQLTTATGDDTAPAWSADGSKIAFQSKRDANPEIYVMNNDGTNQRRLTFNTTQDSEPSWSPNGQKITFLSNRTNAILNVWVMDATGANQRQLTSTAQPDGTPSFSPNGTKILFASKRGSNGGTVFDIYTMNPDGSSVVRLTNSKSGDFEPSWARDGTKIAFTSLRDGNQEIYTMNDNGTGALRLTNNSAIDNQPDW